MAEDKKTGAGAEGATPDTNKIKALEAALKAEQEKSKKLEAEVEASKKIIAKQAADLEVKEIQAGSKKPIVMVDKTPYKFLGQGTLIVDGKNIQAEDLIKDMDAVKALIKAGSGLFVKYKKPSK
ncbi:hypothetical protein PBT90_16685 [Algoriphagus halophytocola]|uniref:hypothetical protein n=1 Tax=Algoriphagus halophytocola TaxID=2991499 RepID=UPI0022DE2FB4|nr:hypothetical protein [Algoriphagus sp. TR-M9]WBL42374.1 hypothetical protein PBT90_16685 [Algoriphagus sp. TR-M9]